MKFLLALALGASLLTLYFVGQPNTIYLSEDGYRSEFISYMTEHQKSYSSQEEFDFRLSVFKQNLDKINAHNANPDKTHTMGLNDMADWTTEEFNQLLGFRQTGTAARDAGEIFTLDKTNLKEATPIDWREKGAVTSVKNQGSCGSCWTFSAVAAMEFLDWQWNDELADFSEQQLVDCCHQDGSAGCNGGEMTGAYKCYSKGDVGSSGYPQPTTYLNEYPYQGVNNQCNNTALDTSVSQVKGISHYTLADIDKTGETLKAALQYRVPSIGVDASDWHLYSGGIMTECTNTFLNHGVAAVGWGHDDELDIDYIIIKNSWNSRWGEGGYIRVAANNACGVTEEVTWPEYRC